MKKFAIEFKWGVIFTLTTLLWMLLERLAGLHDSHIDKHAIYTNLFAIPAVVVFVFALLDKRKNFYGNKMSWLDGFLSGLVISIVVAILTPISQYITIKYITPDYFQNAIEYAIESGKMTSAEAAEYFNLTSYILQSAFGAVLMGAITSAIVAIFIRKR
jgi:hypothetical protein